MPTKKKYEPNCLHHNKEVGKNSTIALNSIDYSYRFNMKYKYDVYICRVNRTSSGADSFTNIHELWDLG